MLAHGGPVGLAVELGVLAVPIGALVALSISQRRAERHLDDGDELDR